MLRRLLIPLLAVGTVAGYASGFHSLRCARERHESFERHIAKVCIDAARDPSESRGSARAPGPPF